MPDSVSRPPDPEWPRAGRAAPACAQVEAVLGRGDFDRLLGSVHSLAIGDEYAEPPGLYPHLEPADVLTRYLAEVVALAHSDAPFQVLAHIDYPVRSWPARAGTFDPIDFEDNFREALRAIADSGRALEVSTKVPLHRLILRWWREEGGQAVSFGSDAHEPSAVARGFRDAVDLTESEGFRPRTHPLDLWGRR